MPEFKFKVYCNEHSKEELSAYVDSVGDVIVCQCDKCKKEARDSGYDKGNDAGYKQGLEDAREEAR